MATRKTATAKKTPVDKTFTAANDHFGAIAGQFGFDAETVRENVESLRSRFETVGGDLIEAARQDTADAVAFVNELVQAKTVGDALEIQRNYWTNLFETRIERAREWTNASVEATRDAFEPASKALAALPGFAAFEKAFPFGRK